MALWTPASLNEIVGNSQTVDFLRSIVAQKDKAPRGFILDGPSGCGKTTVAKLFGKSLCGEIQYVTRDKIQAFINREDITEYPCIVWDHAEALTSDHSDIIADLIDKGKGVHIFVTETASKVRPNLKTRSLKLTLGTLSHTDMSGFVLKLASQAGLTLPTECIQSVAEMAKGCPAVALNLIEGYSLTQSLPSESLEDKAKALLQKIAGRDDPWDYARSIMASTPFTDMVAALFSAYSEAFFSNDKSILAQLNHYKRIGDIFIKWSAATNAPPSAIHLLIKELQESDQETASTITTTKSQPAQLRGRFVVGTELDQLLALSEVTGDT